MRTIPLTNRNHPGFVALVDDEDWEWLSVYEWHLRCDRKEGTRYAVRKENGKPLGMHVDVALPPAGLVVDHLNGDSLDNRRGNLDPCTFGENSRRGQIRRWAMERRRQSAPPALGPAVDLAARPAPGVPSGGDGEGDASHRG